MEDRIKAVRKAHRLTQQEFADRLGVKRNSIAMYEIGGRSPSAAVVTLICRTFGVREEWLLVGEGDMYVETPASMLDRLADERDMGPGGRLLLKSILRVYEELGEDKCIEMIYDLLPDIQQAVQDKMAADFTGAAADQGDAPEQSASV